MGKETNMEHSAEWLRGVVHGIELMTIGQGEGEALRVYRQQLAAAESREAGEPSTECLMQILRDGQADHWAATCGSDEGGFQPSEWVLEAEKVLAGEYSGSRLAEQLAAAQERLSDLQNERDVAVYVIELSGHVANHGRDLLAARDARMKALGAAKVWEIVAERSKLVGDSAGEQYARAEAARLAEGE